MRSPSVVLVGPLPPPLGGATVLFSEITQVMREASSSVQVVNTSPDGLRPLRRGLRVLGDLRRLRPSELVMVCGSWPVAVPLGFLVSLRTLRWRSLMILRLFGGDYTRRLKRPIARGLVRAMLWRMDVIEVEGHACASAWRRAIRRVEVREAPNIRARSVTRPRLQPGDPVRVGYAGRLCEAKGLGVLCELTRAMSSRWDFVVVGPEGEESVVWADRLSAAGAQYLGEMDPSEMSRFFASIDVLVVPTTTWPEGHPGVIIEAFREGVPVVASAVGGIPDLVDDTVGRLVRPGSAADIGRAIREITRSAQHYSTLSAGSVGRFERFGPDSWRDEVIRLVQAKSLRREGAR